MKRHTPMRLVLCVDRDDDLGRKTGIAGPVVGRAGVLEAATKLGVADPEDADTNAMLGAVHLYDELVALGEEVEVAVLTGSAKVGFISDRRVAEQFDQVLREHPMQAAVLVSDGAEDEYLFPILASRVRIDGVHRVIIRQAESLESTYYTLVRALKDPKLRAKTVLPFALVLLILGVAAANGVIGWGVIGLSIVLGVYLIFWTFDLDEAIIDSIRSASGDIRQGSVAFGFGLFSLALVGVGFLAGYNNYIGLPSLSPIDRVVLFLRVGVVWWVVAAAVWEGGRALRRYLLRGRIPRSFPIATTSIVGTGFVGYGILNLVDYLEAALGPSLIPLMIAELVVGFALVIGAGALNQYLKGRGTPHAVGTTAG